MHTFDFITSTLRLHNYLSKHLSISEVLSRSLIHGFTLSVPFRKLHGLY